MTSSPSLDAALTAATRGSSLLVATDFDGVLAPLVLDPMTSAATPGTLESLRSLAASPGVHVALVSGRDLATLRLLTGIGEDEPIVLIGSHGAESSSAAVRSAMERVGVTPQDEQLLAVLREEVTALVRDHHPQVGIELKAAAVVVHTRGLATDVADRATAAARDVGLAHPGVTVRTGKSVLELSVSHADKGSAVVALGRERGATARVYLGDDVTDEDVFLQMTQPEDLTIKVGPGSTVARYRVDDEAAVATLLARLEADIAARRT